MSPSPANPSLVCIGSGGSSALTMDGCGHKAMGMGCLHSDLNSPRHFHENCVFQSHIRGEILSEQSFKQNCCLSLCFNDRSFGDPRCASCQPVRMPRGCCSAAPLWTGHSRSLWRLLPGAVVSIPIPLLPAPFFALISRDAEIPSEISHQAAPSSLLPVLPCCLPRHDSCTPPCLPLCCFRAKYLFHAHFLLLFQQTKPFQLKADPPLLSRAPVPAGAAQMLHRHPNTGCFCFPRQLIYQNPRENSLKACKSKI